MNDSYYFHELQKQIRELEKKNQDLEQQMKNVQGTTDNISDTLEVLKECARIAFPEAYQKYLEKRGDDD